MKTLLQSSRLEPPPILTPLLLLMLFREQVSESLPMEGANSHHTDSSLSHLHNSTLSIVYFNARSVFRKLADFPKANYLLDELDLGQVFVPSDIDQSWINWTEAFLSIMDMCIPHATLPTRKIASMADKDSF